MSRQILIVDDDQAMCEMLDDDLSNRGYSIRCHTRAEEAFEEFMSEPFDTVVTDLRMPGLHGIDFCRRLTENRSDVPVIVITAFGSLQTAVEAIRAGAYDFVTKPIELDMLAIVIERALEHRSLRKQIRFLKQRQWQSKDFDDFIGKSAVMERLFEQITRVADQQVPVLISGESGTGKELVAQALHQRSDRRDKPFVPVNCAAVPGMLLESELFGHRRGAFTDARSDRQGLFLAAHGGTLFLDEIAEMPLELQPKLLRVLESGAVRPIGENREIPSDVRILAATNQDLDSAIRQGDFRQDLFFRVNVVHIDVPPLRSRGFDILLLAKHFLQQIARRSQRPVKGFSDAAADKLLAYHWPGNVRELKNAIERAVAMARLEELTVEDLPEQIRNYQRTSLLVAADTTDELIPLEDFERQYVEHVLGKVGGNKSEAARILGLGRRTLYRKMERWGL